MNEPESTTVPADTVFRSPCTDPRDVQRFQSFSDDHRFLPEERFLHMLFYDFDINSVLTVRAGKAMTTPGAAESGAFPRENLDGNDWSVMLQADDRFARWCEWDRLLPEDWVSLLRKKPHFIDRLPESVEDRFTGFDWALILEERPELESRCDWSRLEPADYAVLASSRPEYADGCPWNRFTGSDWALLLRYQPRFADRCDWSKLRNADWKFLLDGQPQFADRRPAAGDREAPPPKPRALGRCGRGGFRHALRGRQAGVENAAAGG